MDKIPILVALIGVIGGLIGGGMTTVANYVFKLEEKRHERLLKDRSDVYVKWLEVRTLSRQADELNARGDKVKAKVVDDEYERRGREVMGKIANYGGTRVVNSIADWYRADIKMPICDEDKADHKALFAEIKVHQAMRGDLISDEDQVSDENMAILLLQCYLPATIKN